MRDGGIPEDAIVDERFVAASGPGGQNVNKVATAVQLRIDVYRLRLPPYAFRQLRTLAGSRLNGQGELVITARRFRTQEQNRQDARERLGEMIDKALQRQPRRVATKPSRAAKARRVDAKKSRARVKSARGRVKLD